MDFQVNQIMIQKILNSFGHYHWRIFMAFVFPINAGDPLDAQNRTRLACFATHLTEGVTIL